MELSSSDRKDNKIIRIILFCSFACLTACASNPYIEDTHPDGSFDNNSIEYALEHAEQTWNAYSAKISQEFTRQQLLSAGIISLAASAIGLAAYGADTDVILGVGLGGGLAYQLGTWNSSDDRFGIYLEGLKALDCSVVAIGPIRISDTEIESIKERVTSMMDAYDDAAMATGKVTTFLAMATAEDGPKSQLVLSAESELAEMSTIFGEADALFTRASSLELKADQAGVLLDNNVLKIKTAIKEALDGTRANLSSLPNAIQGLVGSVNSIVPGLDVASPLANAIAARNAEIAADNEKITAQGFAGGQEKVETINVEYLLALSLGDLRAARQKLIPRISNLSGSIQQSPDDLEKIKNDLEGCNVDVSQISSDIRIDGNIEPFTQGTAGTQTLEIKGGTTPYSAELTNMLVDDIKLRIAGINGLVVSTTPESKAGSYSIRVKDSANHSKTLAVTIAGQSTNTSTDNKDTFDCNGYQSREPVEICLLQHVVETNVDGKFGANSCTALKNAREILGFAEDSIFATNINDDTMKAINKAAGIAEEADIDTIRSKLKELNVTCPTDTQAQTTSLEPSNECKTITDTNQCPIEGARCQFECSLSTDDIRILREKLVDRMDSLQPTPLEFDDPLREAIAKFQEEEGIDNPTGNFTELTAKAFETKYASD